MRLLVDTQCWLWMLADPGRLNARARELLSDGRTQLLISAAVAWEISIKHALGKLVLPAPPAEYVPSRMAAQGATALPVQLSHALRAGALPVHHHDPFDRLLVAQAQLEKLTLATADEQLRAYGLDLLWAS